MQNRLSVHYSGKGDPQQRTQRGSDLNEAVMRTSRKECWTSRPCGRRSTLMRPRARKTYSTTSSRDYSISQTSTGSETIR
ncbi:hypothetical protein LSAT2_032578 [Lamellibrachia satsuma]|nr:hypothetical protein LSAT2_032578 [Lamellibrachia satsuma]